MKVKVHTSNDIKEIDIFSYAVGDILDIIEKDVELKYIRKVELILTLVPNDLSKLEELKRMVARIQKGSSVFVEFGHLKDYMFSIKFEGMIVDVISMISLLCIYNDFERVDTYIKTDCDMIKNLLKESNERFDMNFSLVLRYISERNGNENINTVFEMLKHDFKKKELKEILSIVFKKIYGVSKEEAKYQTSNDKLDLGSIDDKKLKEMEDETAMRLDDSPSFSISIDEVLPR